MEASWLCLTCICNLMGRVFGSSLDPVGSKPARNPRGWGTPRVLNVLLFALFVIIKLSERKDLWRLVFHRFPNEFTGFSM